MKNQLVFEIVSQHVKAIEKPVTRLRFQVLMIAINAVEIAKIAEGGWGASAVAVHGRTKRTVFRRGGWILSVRF